MVRFHKTDLIGLVGLALLLVWTPAYYAQDPLQQTLTGGHESTLPYPKDGDRLELSLHIRAGDGPVEVIGPVLTLAFEAVAPDPRYPGVVGRLAAEWHPWNASASMVRYVRPAEAAQFLFDDSGRVLYQQGTRQSSGPDAVWREEREWHAGRTGCHATGHLLNEIGQTHRYEPDAAALEDLLDGIGPERYQPLRCGDGLGSTEDRIHDAAFQIDDRVAYGTHILRSDRWYQHLGAGAAGRDIRTCTHEADQGLPEDVGQNEYRGMQEHGQFMVFPFLRTTPFTYACDVRQHAASWNWIDPAFPIPVGQHLAFTDAQGHNVLTIDLVPTLVERGTGPDLFQGWPAPRTQPFIAPTATVAGLKEDPTPLVNGRAVRDAYKLAEDAATPDQQALLQRAELVAFDAAAWRHEYPTQVATPLGPLVVPEPTRDVQITESWAFVVREASGALHAYRLQVITNMEGQETALRDECRTADGPPHPFCGQTWSGPAPAVLSPSQLMATLEATPFASGPRALEPSVSTSVQLTYDIVGGIDSQGARRGPGFAMLQFQPAAVPGTPDHDPTYTDVSWNLERGTWSAVERRAEGDTPAEASRLSAASVEQVPMRPIATTAAWTGVLLVLVSILARAVSAAKAGALTGAFVSLYAKIRRDAVLDHTRREAIMHLVESDPGVSLREVQARLGYGWGSTVHHVETLCRNGLLVDLALNRNRHLFVAGTAMDERRRRAAERDSQLAAVLAAIQAEPGLRQRDLVARLDRPESTLSRLSKHLEGLGLVDRRRVGRTVRMYPRAPDGNP